MKKSKIKHGVRGQASKRSNYVNVKKKPRRRVRDYHIRIDRSPNTDCNQFFQQLIADANKSRRVENAHQWNDDNECRMDFDLRSNTTGTSSIGNFLNTLQTVYNVRIEEATRLFPI